MTRVALVDDETSILTSVKIALEAEGLGVDCYSNGQDALDGILAKPADIGVFDINDSDTCFWNFYFRAIF